MVLPFKTNWYITPICEPDKPIGSLEPRQYVPPPVTPKTVGNPVTVMFAVVAEQLGAVLLVKVKLVVPPAVVPVTV